MVVFPRWLEGKFLAGARRERLAGPVYAAMVDNLFGTPVGFAALGFSSILLAALTFGMRPGIATAFMFAAMLVIVALRTILMIDYRCGKRLGTPRIRAVVNWEIAYAIVGISLMLVIGCICAYNIANEKSDFALVVSIVVQMGIAGCIAGRNGSRPAIVRLQLIACFSPSIIALLLRHDLEHYALGGLIVLFVLATMSSVRSVYTTLCLALEGGRQKRLLSKRLERTLTQFDAALNNMTSGLLLFDNERRLLVANERVKELFGRPLVESLIGRPIVEISEKLYAAFQIDEAEAQTLTARFKHTMITGGEATLPVVDRRRQRVFDMRLRAMADGRAVFNVDDVTDQRTKDKEIFRLAHYDVLTGLYNRLSLMQYIQEIIAETCRHDIVIMYLDLDRFKEVNDGLGHAAGDEVLIEVARRLSANVHSGDFLARIGGDEFVLVFMSPEDRSSIDLLAQRLIKALSAVFVVSGKKITIGASAGLSLVGWEDESAEEALRKADVALYEAKFRGRARTVWYEPAMDDRTRQRREMVLALREAFETGDGLSLHYQPVFDSRSGQIVACEALMRWTHKSYGIVPPSAFIPLAEENDLICTLGRWCLERACLDALEWPNDIKVAVNVSGLQFNQDKIPALVQDVLRRCKLSPDRLEIEVTESVFASDLDRMTLEFKALADQGVSIALDDFGTGFSSLSLVHKLPFDKVKLDRSFVAQLDTDRSMVSLIASIIRMMQAMQKVVVIEGVETAEQLAMITSGHGRLIQGYYFSYPLPQLELLALFERHRLSNSALKRRV